MARKSKPASMITGNDVSPEILKLRAEQEQRLKGTDEMLFEIPEYLDDLSKGYYIFILNELKDTGVLCNVDKPTLEQTADCLSKIRQADEIINQEGIMVESMDRYGNITAKEHPMIKTKQTYLQRYMQLSNCLGLDPSARASLATKKVETAVASEALKTVEQEIDEMELV